MTLSSYTKLDEFLRKRMPGFSPRLAQREMAALVDEAISSQRNALIEAGTGTGKTYAYLLPALLSDKRVMVSTGTKNLQDQLFKQDLPFINESFGKTTALLKGRANYVCLERLNQQISTRSSRLDDVILEKLVSIYQWSEHSRTGDLTELLDEEDLERVQGLVTSTVDNCLGQQCPSIDKCPVYKARAAALEADVVVVNHHLLFADLALKERDLGELLPSTDLVILDEAHQVEDVARNFYGDRLSSRQMSELASDVVREQRLVGLDDPDLIESAEKVAESTQQLVEAMIENKIQSVRSFARFRDEIETVDISMSDLIARLYRSSERSQGLARCYSRACRLSDMFALLTQEVNADESAHWVETHQNSFTIHLVPLDVSPFIKPLLHQQSRTWILVSATLTSTAKFLSADTSSSDEKPFALIKASLGFDTGLVARFASPFDFTEQVAGYVPPDLPNPGHQDFTALLVSRILPLVRTHKGRSLLLFTSHQALAQAANQLQSEYDLSLMVQGTLSKRKLIDRFRQTPRAILMATHSFWEGVDLSGTNLRLLVIDKLPFTSPDNPIFQARLNRTETLGGNGFMEISLPEAAITLKQGFGRLIRQETDKGLFVLGDPRFVSKPYGKVLKKSLPEMNWLDDAATAMNYLESLS